MDEQQQNTEAAAPLRPVSLGGMTYLVGQPTPSQQASLILMIGKRLKNRSTPIGLIANDPAFKLLPERAQVEAAREAAKLQSGGSQPIDPRDILQEMYEPAVLAFMFWLLARGNHPGLKLEDIAPHITEANAAEVFAELNEASGMQSLGGTPGLPR